MTRQYLDTDQIQGLEKDKIADLSLWECSTHFELDSIVIKQLWRKRGVGTKTMKALLNLSTESNKKIYLTPHSLYGSSRPRLLQFYRRLGFRKNKDLSVSHQMVSTNI